MAFVANFICFSAVQKIIYANWLRFDKVTESLKVGTFFETQCGYLATVNDVKCTLTPRIKSL